jgi:AraC-like DNA-binding protein
VSKRSVPNDSDSIRRQRHRAGREPLSRAAVVSRVVALIDAKPHASFQLSDLCAVAGVSERTLRTIIREQFGIGPKKLLRTRKLHSIRMALRLADGRAETVSSVAARFGLSDAGRMAKDYYALFGEYPGTTLMHPHRAVRGR